MPEQERLDRIGNYMNTVCTNTVHTVYCIVHTKYFSILLTGAPLYAAVFVTASGFLAQKSAQSMTTLGSLISRRLTSGPGVLPMLEHPAASSQ